MSLALVAVAAIAASSAGLQSESDPFSLTDARNLEISGEHPRVVVLIRSGEGETRRGVAIAASVRMERSPDASTITPIWAATRTEWTAEGVASSKEITQSECPALIGGLATLGSLRRLSPALPFEPSEIARRAVPYPDIRLHQSFTIWTRSSADGDAVPDSDVEYNAVGGPVAEIAEGFLQQIESCWPVRW